MERSEIQKQWEAAAPGWAKWEDVFTSWTKPATEAMLNMAGVVSGAKVLDLACGTGSQTLIAARRVGTQGHVVACDISETMLKHLSKNASAAQLNNISTVKSAAEELNLPVESFDAAICSLGLMLFINPGKALASIRSALKADGKVAVTVFTTPAANAFMSKPMQILLRCAGKNPPSPGQPGIFSLGAPGIVKNLFTKNGFVNYEERTFSIPLQMSSSAQTLEMMKEAFGAYRAVISDCTEDVRTAAWAEVSELLKGFETENGFKAPAEVMVAAGVKH